MNEDTGSVTRPERRDAAMNRQRIIEAALRLFEQHGVEQVSMNQIAMEAKIGPGTLYRRYRNKSELCLDLMKDNLDLLFDDLETYLDSNKSKPPAVRLRGMLQLFIRFRERKAQLLAGVEDGTTSPRSRPRSASPVYDELHQLVVRLFDEMDLPELSGGHSTFRADMLLWPLASDGYLFQRDVRGHSPDQILDEICRTYIPQQLLD
ncbi:TetR family transcriptional regulator [Paenibacillus cellulosilyticus]|uniref:TetR family transcriptional regulator n=1 Tax=Paenibacillus cellulosilyticus TaxID=375489 RepID=A0A2V2YZT7_9BACL|nr:TetR/AcrR family transcriptional regulator [Paenibacillus cellulosilyticus]PWW08639.1 TetR family transcriptional regulator [Paenibacillus cellulosilyticus]QKS48206.1 TetR/AcrR family transcriptional regulator [Paenibacillus cellulosilyticus]